MALFRRKALRVLDRLYGFLSAETSTDKLQLENPIQLVHDVSREAELAPLGPGFGFLFYGYTWGHTGGSKQIAIDLYNAAQSISDFEIGEPIRRGEISIFLWDVQVWCEDPSDITILEGSLNYAASNGGVPFHPAEQCKPLFQNDGTTEEYGDWAATGDIDTLVNQVAVDPHLPFPVMDGGKVCWQCTSNSQEIYISLLFWLGKSGVMAPSFR